MKKREFIVPLLLVLLTSFINATTYEDGEDGTANGWSAYSTNSNIATITNVYDSEKKSKVISLNRNGGKSSFVLGHWSNSTKWNNKKDKLIQWSMKYTNGFIIYVSLETTEGQRYLMYRPRDNYRGTLSNGQYIYHGIGAGVNDGTWQTFTRDLEADLKDLQPNNSIVAVNSFQISGEGLVDDIGLMLTDDSNGTQEDTTPPVITLNGDANVTIEKDGNYTELNATALDDVDGNVSVTVSGTIDTATVGVYTVTYTAIDSANNSASKTRTVNVIKKIVEAPLTLESNSTELNLGKSILLTVKSGETQDVSSDVEWIVTPSDSAEMSNNILTAKKEGNVTVEAKYQGKTSNKLLFDVHWVINGHILPPEPDEAKNSATLGGVDSNNNGVRDDVERKIREKYSKPLHSALFMYEAKFCQRTLVEPTSNAIEIQKDATKTIDCEMYLMDFDEELEQYGWGLKNSRYVKNITFNNADRVEKYLKYNLALSGGSYGSSFEDENIDACSPEVVNVLKEMKK